MVLRGGVQNVFSALTLRVGFTTPREECSGTCADGRQRVRIHNSRGSAKAHRVVGVRVSTNRFSLIAQRRLILMVASRTGGYAEQVCSVKGRDQRWVPPMNTEAHKQTQTDEADINNETQGRSQGGLIDPGTIIVVSCVLPGLLLLPMHFFFLRVYKIVYLDS